MELLLVVIVSFLLPVNCTVNRLSLVLARELFEYECPYQTGNATCSKFVVTVNGTVPGPTLKLKLNQAVEITVINTVFDDYVVVHWHGMTQRNSPFSDGVPHVTQCLIPHTTGSNSMVYSFTPDSAGTFWYHGHYNEQYNDGLIGPIIVYADNEEEKLAAAGAPYTHDGDAEWVWMFSDWYEVPATDLLEWYLSPASEGDEPMPDAYIVNGHFTNDFNISLQDNEPVRVRVINAGVLSMCNISIDGLPLLLVELDGVATQPLLVPYIVLDVAQRASFIIDWSLLEFNTNTTTTTNSVWFRLNGIPEMYATYDPNIINDNLFGTYSNQPLNLEWSGVIFLDKNLQEPPSYTKSDIPKLNITAGVDINMLAAAPLDLTLVESDIVDYIVDIEVVFEENDSGINLPYINGANYETNGLALPELYQFTNYKSSISALAYSNGFSHKNKISTKRPKRDFSFTTTTSSSSSIPVIDGDANNPFYIPFNKTVEVRIFNTDGGSHPFHLHGHSFSVIATSDEPDASELYKGKYVRRDVISIPAEGWGIFRFRSDNPGVWFFHVSIL